MNHSDLMEKINCYQPEFVKLRRDIHMHPELAFKEERTSKIISGCLRQWGYDTRQGLGGTGVVGQLRRGDGRRAIGIRADMDALPIEEDNTLPYASQNPGVMHACGHDGHVAMLLCAAKFLALEGHFSGTLNLIFQPAEEICTACSGAVRMVQDGLFEEYPCDAIFAMHNMPGIPQGKLMFCTGPAMASSDVAHVVIHGRGGHGARPHETVDAVTVAAHVVTGLQTIVSRNIDPRDAAVVTVGSIRAGLVNNVIAEEALLEICIRALDPAVRKKLHDRITDLIPLLAKGFGATATIGYEYCYPVLVNDVDETAFAQQVGADLLGANGIVREGEPRMGSEDFAFMLERVPGSYVVIGNGENEAPIHNPGYRFNDANIAVGGAYWALLAQRFLE